jgi:hypothetical protein
MERAHKSTDSILIGGINREIGPNAAVTIRFICAILSWLFHSTFVKNWLSPSIEKFRVKNSIKGYEQHFG